MRFFNKINLQTPESVELEFTLAGIGNRAFALLIDYLTLGAAILLSLVISIFLTYQIYNQWIEELLGDTNKIIQWLWAIELLLSFAIYVGYFVLFETIWQGQTPGKKRVHIRVICDDGKPAGIAQATIRALLRPIDDFLFIGVFFITLGKKEKRIGDLLAGTIVVQEEKPIHKAEFAISQQAKDLANQLGNQIDFHQLSPENFAIIRNYLQRREMMIAQARRELARKLAIQVREILELEDIPPNTTANNFLEAVYLGYQRSQSNYSNS